MMFFGIVAGTLTALTLIAFLMAIIDHEKQMANIKKGKSKQ